MCTFRGQFCKFFVDVVIDISFELLDSANLRFKSAIFFSSSAIPFSLHLMRDIKFALVSESVSMVELCSSQREFCSRLIEERRKVLLHLL
jgi:hypothetical protein